MGVSFRVVILWLHLLAVVVWIGGLVFQSLVLGPALARTPSVRERLRFTAVIAARFRVVIWPAIGLILLTGLYNVMNVFVATTLAGGRLPSAFARLLSLKVFLVVLMIVSQAVQRFALQPRMVAGLARLSPDVTDVPLDLLKVQQQSRLCTLLTLGMAALVIFLGLLLQGA